MFPQRVNRKLCWSPCPPTIYIHPEGDDDDDAVGVAPSSLAMLPGARAKEGKMGRMGVGNGSARRVACPPRRAAGMTKCSRGMQGVKGGWLPEPDAIRVLWMNNEGGTKNNCVTLYFNTPAGEAQIPPACCWILKMSRDLSSKMSDQVNRSLAPCQCQASLTFISAKRSSIGFISKSVSQKLFFGRPFRLAT